MVSKLYKLISGPFKPLPVEGVCNRDLNEVNDREICLDMKQTHLSCKHKGWLEVKAGVRVSS